jgi:NAD-dependent dihydropyrimidine dehydrogenase PreA subunit
VIESIDMTLCNGCGICVRSCWSDVIRMDEQTEDVIIKYRDDCSSCAVCEMDCPKKAIHVSPKLPVRQITCWGI